MISTSARILITGGAGLVGQNLLLMLREQGFHDLCVLDRNVHNLAILRQHNPGIETVPVDLSVPGT